MPLSDAAVRNPKPEDKPYKKGDEKGMFLLVTPNGGKWWRLKYRFGGKEKLLSLGTYPDVSMAQARERRDEARKQMAPGTDPGEVRKATKAADVNTFEAIAREFMLNNAGRWSASHHRHSQEYFERDVFPWIGSKPIKEITALELLRALNRIRERSALETSPGPSNSLVNSVFLCTVTCCWAV